MLFIHLAMCVQTNFLCVFACRYTCLHPHDSSDSPDVEMMKLRHSEAWPRVISYEARQAGFVLRLLRLQSL